MCVRVCVSEKYVNLKRKLILHIDIASRDRTRLNAAYSIRESSILSVPSDCMYVGDDDDDVPHRVLGV